jgi:hypothetical protein
MSRTHFFSFTRENLMDIAVEYSITDYIPHTFNVPAEGGEVTIINAWTEPSGDAIELTENEQENLPDLIFLKHDFDDQSDYEG